MIYTHDEAAQIVELFEKVLDKYNIKIPSPEDYEREEDNDAKLYGTTYGDLVDEVENYIIDLIFRAKSDEEEVVTDVFSGNI